jgi:hypothetical protein
MATISVFVTFADLLYMLFIAPSPLPLTRSEAWYSRPRYDQGLGNANLKVPRLNGLN